MELASELLALKGKGGGSGGAASSSSFGTISTPASSATARPSSALRSASTSRLAVGGSARVRFGVVSWLASSASKHREDDLNNFKKSPDPQRAHTPRQQQQHTPGAAPSEGEILRKQLQLTQALLDEELRKNHNLRRDIAHLSSTSGTVRIGGLGGRSI